MTANATPSVPLLDIEPAELPPECLLYPEEEDHVVAGNGSCMSCYPNCKGYRPGPNSYCSTPGCGHSFTMHH
jgi:hypothetical protein